jgi:hypothetical protein
MNENPQTILNHPLKQPFLVEYLSTHTELFKPFENLEIPRELAKISTDTDALKNLEEVLRHPFYLILQLIQHWETDINTLVEVITSQKRLLDYQAVYNAFLLEQISEEEFIKAAETFSYLPKRLNIDELTKKLSCLMQRTHLDFSVTELSDLFECERETVEQSLANLRSQDATMELSIPLDH